MKTNELLTTPEACVYLRVSRTTLARLVQSGRIPPPLRVTARRNLWLREDLDRYFVPYAELVEDESPVIDVDAEGRDADGNSYDMLPSREALDAGLIDGRNVVLRYPIHTFREQHGNATGPVRPTEKLDCAPDAASTDAHSPTLRR